MSWEVSERGCDSGCLIDVPKGCVPLGTYREKEIKGLMMESQGDYWVVRSYNDDGHNGALKAIMCSVTPMRSYMVRSG